MKWFRRKLPERKTRDRGEPYAKALRRGHRSVSSRVRRRSIPARHGEERRVALCRGGARPRRRVQLEITRVPRARRKKEGSSHCAAIGSGPWNTGRDRSSPLARDVSRHLRARRVLAREGDRDLPDDRVRGGPDRRGYAVYTVKVGNVADRSRDGSPDLARRDALAAAAESALAQKTTSGPETISRSSPRNRVSIFRSYRVRRPGTGADEPRSATKKGRHDRSCLTTTARGSADTKELIEIVSALGVDSQEGAMAERKGVGSRSRAGRDVEFQEGHLPRSTTRSGAAKGKETAARSTSSRRSRSTWARTASGVSR